MRLDTYGKTALAILDDPAPDRPYLRELFLMNTSAMDIEMETTYDDTEPFTYLATLTPEQVEAIYPKRKATVRKRQIKICTKTK